MEYSLQFDGIPETCFIGSALTVKVALVHTPSGGIGRDTDQPFQLSAAYKTGHQNTLNFNVEGNQLISRSGFATVMITFPEDSLPGDVALRLNGNGVSTPSPAITKLIRYQLSVHSSHNESLGSTFYSQSFGKKSHIKMTVSVVDKNNEIARDVNIPLAISLRYKDSDEDIVVRDSANPILNTFGLDHTLQQGFALVPLRIEDVSSNHQNQDFVIHVAPLDNTRYADVNSASWKPIHVKAKLRPLDPTLTPPKFKLSEYRNELLSLRNGSTSLPSPSSNVCHSPTRASATTPAKIETREHVFSTPSALKEETPPSNEEDLNQLLNDLREMGIGVGSEELIRSWTDDDFGQEEDEDKNWKEFEGYLDEIGR